MAVNATGGSDHSTQVALIGIDWGTTHLRAYRIGREGQPLERRASPLGIGAIRDGQFATALETLIAHWRVGAGAALPIIMCGMIGSRQGWREVPYRACPATLHDAGENLARVDMRSGVAWIMGGLSISDERGRYDVMRGEETQIFGVSEATGRQLIVAPGTHGKWAVVHKGKVESFRTYMTGELYAILRQHSTLGWAATGGEENVDDERSFLQGVQEAGEDPELLHSLFSVRTRTLFERWRPGVQAAYLSGILIGSEVASALRHHRSGPITLIASATFGRWYQAALSVAGVRDVTRIDADQAVARGLWKLSQLRQGNSWQ